MLDRDYDPDNPPATPPSNAHPTLWGLAHLVHTEHVAGTDGWCIACRDPRELSPCPASRIARRAFTLALKYQAI
jgi:hypothetical protein